MNIAQIKRLGEKHPEVLELLGEWQSLSKQHDGMAVALLRKELAEFDRNHTRADASQCETIRQLGERLDASALYARDLNKTIKAHSQLINECRADIELAKIGVSK